MNTIDPKQEPSLLTGAKDVPAIEGEGAENFVQEAKQRPQRNKSSARVKPKKSPFFSVAEKMVGMRYLRSRDDGFVSLITVISLAGIVLGVATLIVVLAVLNGFRVEVRDKILGVNGHVLVRGQGGKVNEPDLVASKIREYDGVKAVNVFAESTVLFSSRFSARGGLLRGVTEESVKSTPILADLISDRELKVLSAGEGIILGNSLARVLGVSVGDSINVVVPNGTKTPFGTMPRLKSIPVGGTFSVGFSEFDSSLGLINLSLAKELLDLQDAASSIEIVIDDPDEAPKYVNLIRGNFADKSLFVQSWQQRNSTFFNALKTERNVMFLVLMLIILIAALNVVSGMVMLVKEKRKEIAVLRTLGVSRMGVARIFLLTGGSIAFVGSISGLVLGLVVCQNLEVIQGWLEQLIDRSVFPSEVYYLSRLPALVDPLETMVVVGIAFVLAIVTAIFPALRAARLDPVKALRHG